MVTLITSVFLFSRISHGNFYFVLTESTPRTCEASDMHLAPNDGVNASSDQNTSMTVEGVNGLELPTQSVLVNNGNVFSYLFEHYKISRS
jgi:hypothetical protein